MSNQQLEQLINRLPSIEDFKDNQNIEFATILCRTSDKKQRNNSSLETQLKVCINWANEKGITAVKELIYIEKETSAYRKKILDRSLMANMKTMILKEYRITTCYFCNIDRLDRTGDEFLNFVLLPIQRVNRRVEFIDVKSGEKIDPLDPMMIQKFVAANSESSTKSKNTLAYMHLEMIDDDIKPSFKSPYGYKKDKDGSNIINYEQAGIVKLIFLLYSSGHSMEDIAKMLSDADVSTATNVGKWEKQQIKDILSNDTYRGTLARTFKKGEHEGKRFEKSNFTDKIIPTYLKDLVGKMKILKDKYGKLKTPFLLSNFLWCDQCQQYMISVNNTPKNAKKKYLSYQCNCKDKQIKKIHTVAIEQIHEVVINIIEKKLNNVRKNNYRSIKVDLKVLKEELRELIIVKENELEISKSNFLNATKMENSSLISIIKYERELMRKELNQLYYQINKVEDLLGGNDESNFMELFNVDFRKLSLMEKRLMIVLFVKRIKVKFGEFKENPVVSAEFDLTAGSFFF